MSYIKHKSEESIEDYLETILILSNCIGNVRSIDIVNKLNYSKASVSVAMKNLKNNNLISISTNGYISLTPEGNAVANKVYERHTLLTDWLMYLGVNPETASSDACKIEHDISSESFEAIKKFVLPILNSK